MLECDLCASSITNSIACYSFNWQFAFSLSLDDCFFFFNLKIVRYCVTQYKKKTTSKQTCKQIDTWKYLPQFIITLNIFTVSHIHRGLPIIKFAYGIPVSFNVSSLCEHYLFFSFYFSLFANRFDFCSCCCCFACFLCVCFHWKQELITFFKIIFDESRHIYKSTSILDKTRFSTTRG